MVELGGLSVRSTMEVSPWPPALVPVSLAQQFAGGRRLAGAAGGRRLAGYGLACRCVAFYLSAGGPEKERTVLVYTLLLFVKTTYGI